MFLTWHARMICKTILCLLLLRVKILLNSQTRRFWSIRILLLFFYSNVRYLSISNTVQKYCHLFVPKMDKNIYFYHNPAGIIDKTILYRMSIFIDQGLDSIYNTHTQTYCTLNIVLVLLLEEKRAHLNQSNQIDLKWNLLFKKGKWMQWT